MTFFPRIQIEYADTPAIDAFNRLRVSSTEQLLSIQQQYTGATIQMESGATGTGVAPSYSTTTRMSTLSATAGSGTSFMQSFEYVPYEPGRSQLIFITGVFGTGVAGATKDFGYFDANNGIIYRQNGVTNLQIGLRTSTSGSPVDGFVAQSSWNIDKFDGTGASGITIDATKDFILVIDLQFLSMGRVRVGFDIGGVILYAHQFLNANVISLPYMQTATLPIQALLTATATATTASMQFKCASVMSEGGNLLSSGLRFSSPETTVTAGNGTRTPVVSIRPKTTFNGITTRTHFHPVHANTIGTANTAIFWELVIGANLSGTAWSDINTSFSSFEYSSTPGSFTNLTGGIVIASWYTTPANGTQAVQQVNLNGGNNGIAYPISLDRAGAVRTLGTITLLATGIGATGACRASIDFLEIR